MRENIVVTRGDSREFNVTFTDSAGDPYDLTDAGITFTVGNLITKTLGDGIAVSDPQTGVATITLEPEDTEGASDSRTSYPYDVEIVLADGRVKTPIRGRFIVVPDVTTH